MEIVESIKSALESIWVNKMRSALTMLGIIIGVAAVIAVVAIGQGGRAAINQTLESMGNNLFDVYPSSSVAETPLTGRDMITLEDVESVRTMIPAVKAVSAESYSSMLTQYGKEKQKTAIIGCESDYNQIRNLKLVEGRFFEEHEDKSKRKVMVINEELAKAYFPEGEVLGKQIYVMNTPFTVIGVVKNNDMAALGGEPSKDAMIPIRTSQTFSMGMWIEIMGQAQSKEEVQEAMDQTVKLLHQRHHSESRYRGYSLDQEIDQTNDILGVVALIIGLIAGISLLVGGIGVMNIMLVSVTERTREIGIRMALGATRKDILIQFLIEAVVICLVGGTLGTLVGAGGAMIVAFIAHWPPLVDPKTIMIAFGFSATIGIFFGLYPANKAAKMDPITALRYE